MIAILDYGLGNVTAFCNVYKRLNIKYTLVSTESDLLNASRIVLPGVGSFDYAMKTFNQSGLRDALDYQVVEKRVPVLGICVGMQMMAKRSEEGQLNGLGWFDAEVRHFDKVVGLQSSNVPHMGWNDVMPIVTHPLFDGLELDARFYFLHSYYFVEGDSSQIMAQTDYNGLYTSAAYNDNIFGIQFHPEKSHHWGIKLLKNFAEMSVC